MKKLSIILALCMVLSLFVGCGATPDATPSDNASVNSTASAVESKGETTDVESEVTSSTATTSTGSTSTASKQETASTPSSKPSSNNDDAISYITKGLVARYDFEDAKNIGKDVSGNNNNLFIWSNGGKKVGQTKNGMNAKLGNAAKFDGNALLAAKTLEDSKTPSKDFLDSINGSYTITFFAKNNNTVAVSEEKHQNLICNGYWDAPTTPNLELAYTYQKDGEWNSFASYLNYGGVMNGLNFRKFAWQADNGGFYEYGKIDTNWYHYALVVNTEKVCIDLYIDGKLVKSNSPGTQGLATQSQDVPFSIGGMAVPSEDIPVRDLLVGEIDDLRVYDRVLSVYEIGKIQKIKG